MAALKLTSDIHATYPIPPSSVTKKRLEYFILR